jgi:hypothetical protein
VPDGDPLGVEADGTNYHFVAYSFFGDPMEEPYVEDIEPFQDFVWGEKDQPVYDNETSRTVSILMRHKFSRVRVRVDASTISDAEITDIDNVVIAGGKEVTMVAKTGAVDSYGADATATLENWVSENNDKAMLSDYAVFCPSLTTITVGTLDLEIDGDPLPLTNKSVTFSQTLAANTSYTVVVDVRANRWAWSNIYWVATSATEGYMTFDRTLVDVEHQYYQGIFFKWGSLIGFSRWKHTHLYVPNVNTETWEGPKTPTEAGWIDNNDVPYNTDYAGTAGSYLYTHNNFSAYTGDICNYIDDDWRIPSGGEFEVTNHSFVAGSVVSGYADGTGIITAGTRYAGASGFAFFPSTGMLWENPTIYQEGYRGIYWTGSPRYDTLAGWLLADVFVSIHPPNNSVNIDYSIRIGMRSVRCIKKLPTD